MKKKIIKTLALCVASIMLFGSMAISVAAEDGQSISINGRETKFIELFRVENGVAYFPVRLVFNDFEDQGYTVIVNPSMNYASYVDCDKNRLFNDLYFRLGTRYHKRNNRGDKYSIYAHRRRNERIYRTCDCISFKPIRNTYVYDNDVGSNTEDWREFKVYNLWVN